MESYIFSNERDPPGEHVGIDINSLKSVANVSWLRNNTIMGRNQYYEAWISYNSCSQNLSVVFTGYKNNVGVNLSVSYIVDLSLYLLEWVTLGFSATISQYYAIHSISSWNFRSILEIENNNTNLKGPIKRKTFILAVGYIYFGWWVSDGSICLVEEKMEV